MTDGMIDLDTDRGNEIGFTSADFAWGSYLWREGDTMIVSFIECHRRGAFRELCERLLSMGLTVHISTPLGRMQLIVRKAGYTQLWIEEPNMGLVEIWEKRPESVLTTVPAFGKLTDVKRISTPA